MKDSLYAQQRYNAWVLLCQARDTMIRVREQELAKYGLTAVQAAALYIIRAIGDGATPAEIARWMLREPQSISELLKRMEKEGLVRKTKGSGHRRNRVLVSLTEKGKQAFDFACKRESIGQIMSTLTEEELKQLSSCLRRIRDNALQQAVNIIEIPFP